MKTRDWPYKNVVQVDTEGNTVVLSERVQTPTGPVMNCCIGPGDVISSIPVMVDYGHHQIHEHEAHSWCSLQTGGLNSGSSYDVRISVPTLDATTRTPHMIFELIATGETEMYLHKDVTWTSGGTAVAAGSAATAIDNRNHNTTTIVAKTKLYVAGGTALTVNGTGTIKYIWYVPAGSVRVGSGDRSTNEIDLASNTEYMLRITSRAAGLKFLVRLDWYEDLGV